MCIAWWNNNNTSKLKDGSPLLMTLGAVSDIKQGGEGKGVNQQEILWKLLTVQDEIK